jgi:hypothetical protein
MLITTCSGLAATGGLEKALWELLNRGDVAESLSIAEFAAELSPVLELARLPFVTLRADVGEADAIRSSLLSIISLATACSRKTVILIPRQV